MSKETKYLGSCIGFWACLILSVIVKEDWAWWVVVACAGLQLFHMRAIDRELDRRRVA